MSESDRGKKPSPRYLRRVRQALTKEVLFHVRIASSRLLKNFRNSSVNQHFEADDLVNIAVEKTLSGVRKWNHLQYPDIREHLIGCMKSELSNLQTSLSFKRTDHYTSSEEIVSFSTKADQSQITPEEKIHRQENLAIFIEFVSIHQPKLVPLTKCWMEDGISKPSELANHLSVSVKEINTKKLALKRLFERKFLKHYITHFRDDLAELIGIYDAIHHKKSRKAEVLAAALGMAIEDVRLKRDRLDRFLREILVDLFGK